MTLMVFYVFTILSVILGVENACDFDIIIKINSLWRDSAPVGILEKLVGSMSYLYIPPVFERNGTSPRCIKTAIEATDKMAEDFHLYEGDARTVKYWINENARNITRSFTSHLSESDDYVFPVYLKNGVFGFWQCRDDYESFANIGVLNYLSRKEETEVKEAIAEAGRELIMLGLKLPSRSGDC